MACPKTFASRFLLQLMVAAASVTLAKCISDPAIPSIFYPFGPEQGDTTASPTNSPAVRIGAITGGLRYYGTNRTSLWLNKNGALTFGTTGDSRISPTTFPSTLSTISVYLAGINFNLNSGRVYYQTFLGGFNLALKKNASQQTTFLPRAASFAVDGDPNTISCTLQTSAMPWWSVKLSEAVNITSIVITGDKNPKFPNRLKKLYVGLSNAEPVVGDILDPNDYDLCTENEVNILPGQTVTIQCDTSDNAYQYVIVQSSSTRASAICLAEVKVFSDAEVLARVSNDINDTYASYICNGFNPTWVFLATWYNVTYIGGSSSSNVNSFQVALATDRKYSFVVFNYGDLTWTGGTNVGGAASTGLNGSPQAQIGFNAGDNRRFYINPLSRTNDSLKAENNSNVAIPGQWIYRIDNGVCVRGSANRTNLARGLPAIQLNTYRGRNGSLATDGSNRTAACTLTNRQSWWAVNLNKPVIVTSVVINNDINPINVNRLNNVLVGLSNEAPVPGQTLDPSSYTLCNPTSQGSIPAASWKEIVCDFTVQPYQYVIVQSSVFNSAICLAEVRVFSECTEDCSPGCIGADGTTYPIGSSWSGPNCTLASCQACSSCSSGVSTSFTNLCTAQQRCNAATSLCQAIGASSPQPGTGTTPTPGCTWNTVSNTNVLGGISNGASTIQVCKTTCVSNPNCNGFDWDPSPANVAAGTQCWLSGPWSGARRSNLATGVTHYDLIRTGNCAGCAVWVTVPNTHALGGQAVNGVTKIDDCQLACLTTTNCNGYDWDPANSAGQLCWLSGPWISSLAPSATITHYNFTSNGPC